MKRNRKGSNAKRTPSQNRITGESSTNQRYNFQSWKKQYRKLDFEFSKGAFTMKTVSVKLNIDRANICRYIAKRRKENRIYLVKYGECPITKTKGVGFYTSDFNLYCQTKIDSHVI
jgi:cell fate regulator YaaT (PSP1 superfamily)